METTMRFAIIDSPIGPLRLVADDEGLRRLEFRKGPSFEAAPDGWREDARALAKVARQVEEYFAGRRKHFDLDLAPEGTEFQKRVWERLLEIPYGETISYGTLATRIGNPKASRAVGLANGSNPIAIVIPCHRVIGSNGTLTGYGGGLPIKEKLLSLERGQIRLVC
jgi:methylated-DNA-[protein]-cysteine S-methyltransferase